MSKWAYIIIKVEHDAPNTEVVARECHWDIDHETIIDAKIVGYVEHDPEFDNTEEEDEQIINEFKEIADVIRNSTDVYGI